MLAPELKRFYSVEDILDYAFRAEAARIDPKTVYEYISPSTSPEALTPEEFIADGIMLKNRAMQNLSMLHRHTISLQFRRPVDNSLESMLNYDLYVLSYHLQEEKKNIKNIHFITDILRDWSPYLRPHHSLSWWAEHMGIAEGTVKSWAVSNDPARKSLKNLMGSYLSDAIYRLESVYVDAGML